MGGLRENRTLPARLVGIGNTAATVENSLAVSQKVKHKLTINTSNSLLCIYPREGKTHVHAKTGTQVFTAADS